MSDGRQRWRCVLNGRKRVVVRRKNESQRDFSERIRQVIATTPPDERPGKSEAVTVKQAVAAFNETTAHLHPRNLQTCIEYTARTPRRCQASQPHHWLSAADAGHERRTAASTTGIRPF